ncbi:MAG: hypothetical protein U9R25_13665 [Chloroflexota bacterium]|nr:hypothetical protein [Chloroflexota bacterium]
MKKQVRTAIIAVIITALLAGCGGRAEPTPTKTPRPLPPTTPLPRATSGAAARAPASEQVSPLPTPTAPQSSLPTPTAPQSPLPTPSETTFPRMPASSAISFDLREPVPVLAADLICDSECNVGKTNSVGLVILDLEAKQLDTWVTNLDPLEGQEYEGWLIDENSVESVVRFNTSPAGISGQYVFLTGMADDPWMAFELSVEPEPDESIVPSSDRSIGGPLRRTAMGEALYHGFFLPCQGCHGRNGEGGEASALKDTDLTFDQFLDATRQHDGIEIPEAVASTGDLRHVYSWLVSSQ